MYGRLSKILIKNNSKHIEQSFNSALVTSTENSITTHKSICEQMVLWMHLDKRYVSLNELLRLITSPRTSSVCKILTVMRNLYPVVLPSSLAKDISHKSRIWKKPLKRTIMIAIFFSFKQKWNENYNTTKIVFSDFSSIQCCIWSWHWVQQVSRVPGLFLINVLQSFC